MKIQAAKVHYNAFNVWILNFELLPNIQSNLDWYENFTKITRLWGEHNPTNFIENKYCKKKIQAPKVAAIKVQFVNSNWTCELWMASENHSILISLKILPHKLEERTQIYQQVLLNSDIGCKSYSTLN